MGKMIDLPVEYREELITEVIGANIKREKILSIVLIAIVVLLFSLDVYASRVGDGRVQLFSNFSILHVMLIIIPLVFLVCVYFIERAGGGSRACRVLKILHILIVMLVLSICALIAVSTEALNKQPFALIMAMFFIASTVLLSPLEGLLAYSATFAFYAVGTFGIQMNPYAIFENLFFAAMLTIVALIVSRINYLSYVKNFINNKIILGKNEEIDKLYRKAEENLKRRTEELKETVEYEKLRTAFFANISHELRTPLNVIYSAEQVLDIILKSDKVKEKQSEAASYMLIIKQNCFRLIRLIANLIDITKMDAGYFNVSLSNNDVVRIVEDITLSVAKYVEGRGVNLIFDTEKEEKIIACDPDKIERIILNLLSNAVKFTDKGGSIFVNIFEGENKIIISVKDTGVGVPADMREKIFERFVQVDKTTSRAREGSGIGLSIVKSLVEMHGGSITLKSEGGKGSEFIIEIPSRLLPDTERKQKYHIDKETYNVEKINIEFSDIYS